MGTPYFEVMLLGVVVVVVVVVAGPFVGSLGLSTPSRMGVLFATVMGAYLLFLLVLPQPAIASSQTKRISSPHSGQIGVPASTTLFIVHLAFSSQSLQRPAAIAITTAVTRPARIQRGVIIRKSSNNVL